jgi:Amt family ammonium transporter
MTTAMAAVLTIATCSIQWFVIGYTLAYGEGGWFFGNFKHFLHWGVLSEPVGTIPAILFSEFQLVFEATVCAIAVGGFCERGRLLPVVVFIAVSCRPSQLCTKRVNGQLTGEQLWSTFVYCALAHMVWGGGVLGEGLGVLDFAGGGEKMLITRHGKARLTATSNP